jgi:solute:Na+ symporter, SSS family
VGLLGTLDWIVVLAYFVLVFGIAFWSARGEHARETSEDYFLAGRASGWFLIGGSLFASNIGAEHLVGLAGEGARTGVAVAQFEILAVFILFILGWVFTPFYLRSGVFTMPEFLERRYSAAARWYLAVVSIIAYVITKISVTIFAGQVVFATLMGVNPWVGAVIVVVATGIYTVFGGLRAVLYTDLMQTFVLIGGAVAVLIVGVNAVGGWHEMTVGAGHEFMDMWKPVSDPSFPWTGILLGAPILGVWYWCTDQFIVQRVLSGKNLDNARRGTIFAGALKMLPLFIFVIPGITAAVLAKRGEISLSETNAALPTLVGELLPVGLRGLVAAGLLAALMSSLSSMFNSCSTLITWDVYKKIKPDATEKQLVIVGQAATVILTGLGLLWIPMMKVISGSLYAYLQSVQAYISPPIAAVFLLGISWPRLNGAGAMTSLIVGFVLGALRLALELMRDRLGPGLLHDYATMNFLHFAILLFVICSAILVVVSFTRPAPTPERLAGLTYSTGGKPVESDRAWRRNDLLASVVLAAAVGGLWWYFS